MIKRLLYSVAASLAIISCSKVSQSDILGDWTVGDIQVQEITADTDSGWKTQQGAGIVFVQGETITFEKGRIIPCKSVDMGFRQYDNYPGYVSYSFSGAKLTIPSVEYSYYRQDGDNVEAGQMKMQGITLDVTLNGNIMSLSGTAEDTDNLGNVKKRTNVKVELTR